MIKQNVHNIIWLSALIKGRKHLTTNTLHLHALLGELNPNFKKLCPFAIVVCLHPPIIGSCYISAIELCSHVFLVVLHMFFGLARFFIKPLNTVLHVFLSNKRTCHVFHISVLFKFFFVSPQFNKFKHGANHQHRFKRWGFLFYFFYLKNSYNQKVKPCDRTTRFSIGLHC
jgi:hypothetical protein